MTRYYWGDQIKEHAMGGCYSMLGELRNACKIVIRKSEGKRDHLEGVVVDGTIVLKSLAGAEHHMTVCIL